MAKLSIARQRIAQINLGKIPTLTEGPSRSVPELISVLKDIRSQILGIKQFREGPSNDALAEAVNGCSNAILGLTEYYAVKDN